jgi:hypothetical protein
VNMSFILKVKKGAKGDYVCLRNKKVLLIPRRRSESLKTTFPNLFK